MLGYLPDLSRTSAVILPELWSYCHTEIRKRDRFFSSVFVVLWLLAAHVTRRRKKQLGLNLEDWEQGMGLKVGHARQRCQVSLQDRSSGARTDFNKYSVTCS